MAVKQWIPRLISREIANIPILGKYQVIRRHLVIFQVSRRSMNPMISKRTKQPINIPPPGLSLPSHSVDWFDTGELLNAEIRHSSQEENKSPSYDNPRLFPALTLGHGIASPDQCIFPVITFAILTFWTLLWGLSFVFTSGLASSYSEWFASCFRYFFIFFSSLVFDPARRPGCDTHF